MGAIWRELTGDGAHGGRELAARVAAAIVGGYLFTAQSVGALARIVPLTPSAAVLALSMLAIPLYLILILWAFAAKSPYRPLILLLIGSAILRLAIQSGLV